MPDFSTIVFAAKVLWCLVASATLVTCLSVWWPLFQVANITVRRNPRLAARHWFFLPVRMAGGLAWVASCNLLAGVLSLSVPSRIEVFVLPTSWPGWVALFVPCLFIVSALIKLHMAVRLRHGYDDIVDDDMAPEAKNK